MNLTRIISFNADGLGDKSNLGKVMNWIRRYKPMIIMFQETHCADGRQEWYSELWKGECYHSIGSSNSTGVSILLSAELDYTIVNKTIHTEGRYVVLDIIINENKYLLGNYYGPNIDCPEMLMEFLQYLEPTEGQEIIACGDFNFVWNVSMDKLGGRPRTHENSKNLLIEWCNNMDIIDIWRVKHPDLREYTWKSRFPPYIYERLDYFITSASICNKTPNCVIKPGFKSDHRPVILDILFSDCARGPGFWKLNNTLLSDNKYAELITKTIKDAIKDNKGCNPNLLLDTVKCRIRGASVKYSSYIKRINKNNFTSWTEELAKLESKITDITDEIELRSITDRITFLNSSIESFINKETASAAFRCKAMYYEEGEKSSKYFYNLEKCNKNKKSISRLQTSSGLLSDSNDILNEEVRFYKKLYTSNVTNVSEEDKDDWYNKFLSCTHRTLDVDAKHGLNENITEHEVYNILCSFSDNKCPGSDGLSKEFYIFFWEDMKELLLQSYEYSLQTGSLSMDQRKGIISLIPKKGKDTLNLSNWRPLTLLNTDYKILAKLFAYRIKTLLPELIHDDQTGFIPGRYIGCNINRILNSINYCNDNELEAMLVSIDFQKAFDSMEWEFVYKSMQHFGFPLKFIRWIKVMYIDINSCIVNNGNISQLFKPSRGVRQGCPLSPYLFVLGAEILSNYIRSCSKIPPVNNLGKGSCISQYADDTTIITVRNKNVLKTIFDILDDFSIISGLKVNIDKTQVMPIGINLSNISDMKEYTLCDNMTLLGITVCCDNKKMMNINYNQAMKHIKNCLKIWNLRQLSLFGRIEIVKTLGISRLVYIMSLLPSPGTDYLKSIEKELIKFIWKNKPSKIRATVIKNRKDLAGAGMIDLNLKEKCMKLCWLKRLYECGGSWKQMVLDVLGINENTVEYFLHGNIKVPDLPNSLKRLPMWQETLQFWCELNYKGLDDIYNINDILESNIWFNSILNIDKKLTFWPHWYDSGIKTIMDILNHETGSFLTWIELVRKYKIKGSFINYSSILSAIPHKWKKTIRLVFHSRFKEEHIKHISHTDKLLTLPKPVGVIYKDIINNYMKDQPFDRAEKWSNDLGTEVDDLDWYEVIYDSYRCTNSITIRSFMYKFALRAIYPNYILHKMKISESPACPKCGLYNETIFHMFWECSTVKKLIKELIAWIYDVLKVKLPCNPKKLLLYMDLDIDVDYYDIIIFILTIAKMAIYSNVNSRNQVPLFVITNKVFNYEKLERYNANKYKKIQKHASKWQNLYRLAIENEADS